MNTYEKFTPIDKIFWLLFTLVIKFLTHTGNSQDLHLHVLTKSAMVFCILWSQKPIFKEWTVRI